MDSMNTTESTQQLEELENWQWQREVEATQLARKKAIEEFAETLATGNIDKMTPVKMLLSTMVPTLIENYTELKSKTSISGDRKGNIGFMQALSAEVMAAITIRTVLKTLLQTPEKNTAQHIMTQVGRNLWLEYIVQEAQSVDATTMFLDTQKTKMQFMTSEDAIRTIMRHTATRILGEDLAAMPSQEALVRAGKHGVGFLYDLGLIEHNRNSRNGKRIVTYTLSQEVEAFIVDTGFSVAEKVSPVADLMVCPPKQWSSKDWGGYLTPSCMASNPLVELPPKLMQGVRDASLAVDTVNYLQSIPYTVSEDAVEIVRKCWELGGGMLGIPSALPEPKPVLPLPEDWAKETATEEELQAFKIWCRAMNWWYTREIERKQNVLVTTSIIRHMVSLKGHAVWCPTFLDWRGRLYYRGRINPQSPDFVRAVLVFKNKKRLGKRGLYWLKVHIANSLGFDKESFDARARWVDQNWDDLARASEAPWDYELFRDSQDYPVTACVAVRALAEAYTLRNPEEYECNIPVHMDATCSGFQIFAGMTRSTQTALAVNVKPQPNGARADIYTKVCNRFIELLKDDPAPEAQLMLQAQPDRALTKKPCMTLPYGATFIGVNETVRDWLASKLGEDSTVLNSVSLYCTTILIKALHDVLPAVQTGMAFLKDLVSQCKGEVVRWESPLGFVVTQGYRDIDTARIKIRSAGVAQLTVVRGMKGINTRRMSNGISPNVVHTLDAGLMAYTMREMREAGLECASIHDSFGTHPSDVDFLHKAVRRSYVKLFEDFDILENICRLNSVECTLEKGDLDVKDVLKSQFFFS